ncbi:hypothetical protein [Polyangium mundeleinium]|uniref:Uncharacterized protein n=1 Tax=Polyangium mundeleinium TaxID=2995306 RepID=A0ABT5F5F1_9BACT|nr:hypothetical protein [Polyangium mundeleinium]MDC0749329.1 hypothetical protein [Polyangium mundeleinium]
MNHRLYFGSIAILSVLFAACGLGSYQPPSGAGGEGGEGANGGTGGHGGEGGVAVTATGVGGGTGTGGNGGFGGSLPECNPVKMPVCLYDCMNSTPAQAQCIGDAWECPPGSSEASTCPKCCKSALDCIAMFTCVNEVCKEPLLGGQCWSNADCTEAQVCEGAVVCACGQDCTMPDTPGKCAPS